VVEFSYDYNGRNEMTDVLETFTSEDGQWRVQVCWDFDCPSPREDEQLGRIVTWEGYGHTTNETDDIFPSPHDFEDWWNGVYSDESSRLELGELAPRDDPRYLRLPVFKYEHTGVAYRTSDFGDRWDSGQVGWIFTTPETIENTGAPQDSWAEQLSNEVDEYSKWASGECYGYVVSRRVKTCACGECEDWETTEACGGFIGQIWDLPDEYPDMPDDLKKQLNDSYYFKGDA
jgi:hypothetical protein